jgi:hypothetical protein
MLRKGGDVGGEYIRNRFEKALVKSIKVFGVSNVMIYSFTNVREYQEN